MDNFTSIQLKHTDPDTGSVKFEKVADISLSSPWILDMILESFKNDKTYELDPNTDLIVKDVINDMFVGVESLATKSSRKLNMDHGTHPDAKDSMMKMFQLGELAYTCLSNKQSKYGNDMKLGSTIRSKYNSLIK